jgi:hypothetical protein
MVAKRKPKNVMPQDAVQHSAVAEEEQQGSGSELGNLVVSFFNFGELGKAKEELMHHLIHMLRTQPGMVIGGSEVSKEVEMGLRQPAVAGDRARDVKPQYEYLTARLQLPKGATFIAVRANCAESITVLEAKRKEHGAYKNKSKNQSVACSKCLITKVNLRRPVGH